MADDFGIDDAALLGGIIGMTYEAVNEEERAPDNIEDVEQNIYDKQTVKSLEQIQRLDPALFKMITDVMHEQEKKVMAQKIKDMHDDEEQALLDEAVEFEELEK